MNTLANQIRRHLEPLVGLPLSGTHRALDLRCFLFGQRQPAEQGGRSEWALNVQCPWRIEGPEGIVTGRSDLREPIEVTDGFDWSTFDYENGNLQDQRLLDLLGAYELQTGSCRNITGSLVVERVTTDDFGGAIIFLSGGYRLVLFSAGSVGEDWRVFQPIKPDEPHFVIWGGRVDEDDEG